LGGVEDDRRLVIKDYFQTEGDWHLPEAMSALADLSTEDLLDLKSVIGVLHLSSDASELDAGLQPRGFRLLARVPRLPDTVVDRIVERFGSLHKILRASVADLDEVEGVGEARARAIEESLRRLAETSILDRYG
jgi:diadenylate cyclase